MNRNLKILSAILLTIVMVAGIVPMHILADDVIVIEDPTGISAEPSTGSEGSSDSADTTEPSIGDVFTQNGNQLVNDYLSVCVNSNGRYTIGTTGGDPTIETDDGRKMLFGWPGSDTTHTTIAIDDSIFTFEKDGDIVYDAENGRIICSNTYLGVKYTQTLSFVSKTDTGRYDCIEIKYEAENTDTVAHDIGLRIMLDTMLAGNDDAPFRVSGIGDVTTQMEFSGDSIPLYWQAFDSLTDPSCMSQGSFVVNNGNKPDTVQFTSWPDVTNTKWNCPVTEGVANGDSAVTVKWDYKPLAVGASRSYTTYYGLAPITRDEEEKIGPDVPFVITTGLNVEVIENAYTPNPVEYNIYLENTGNVPTGDITCDIELEDGTVLELIDGATYDIGSIPVGGNKQQTIRIKLNISTVEKTETIKFKFRTSDGLTKEVERTITIPALEHVFTHVEANEPTCVDEGNIEYYYCEVCDKYYTDESESEEIDSSDIVIPATGIHTWDDGVTTVEPTCVDGVMTYTCIVCDTTKEEPIPATGIHAWDEGTVSVEPTCLANGLKVYLCTVCGETKNEMLPKLEHELEHVHNPSTCTVKGVDYDVCTNDGDENIYNYTVLELLPHPWDEGVVTVPATCVEDGVMTYTCTVCGETKTEVIPSNGQHTFGPWRFTEVPTYRHGGRIERECELCHYMEERILDKVVPDYTEHDDGTGVEIGYMTDTYGKRIDLTVSNIFDGDSFNFLNKEKGNFDFQIYDITTKFEDAVLQPNGTVLVKLPIPENYDRSRLRIYHVTNRGVEKMDMWIDGDYACFEASHFSAYALVDESRSSLEYGDINGDGKILADDARLALRASAQLEILDTVPALVADVDRDGFIYAGDARQILRYSAQLQAEFEVVPEEEVSQTGAPAVDPNSFEPVSNA